MRPHARSTRPETTMMAQLTHTLDEAPAEQLTLAEQNGRLLDLVGELLEANQRLRFEVSMLEQEAGRTEHALAKASAAFPLLLL
jgi:hypothetical protein